MSGWNISPERIAELKKSSQQQTQVSVITPWPENMKSWKLFLDCETQWNVSMAGAIGINGSFVLSWIKLHTSKKSKIKRLYKDISLIERGALSAMREQTK